MTQIFGIVTRKCVVHLSDRLLSQKTKRGVLPFDRDSNKAIIFQATDAHVIASYTGRAYLDNIPSDTFIAQSLLGRTLTGGGAILMFGRPDKWTDIGRSVERLRDSLSGAFRRLPENERAGDFLVSILGWRENKRNKRVSPVIWELRRPQGQPNEPFEISCHHRWWRWDRNYVFSAIPDVHSSITERIRAQIKERGYKSPDEIKQILIAALRHCADLRPDTVGSSCLQIFLTPLASTQASIRYIADVSQPNEFPKEACGYTPWIVTPSKAFAPTLLQGANLSKCMINSGGFSWVYEGSIGSTVAKKALYTSQHRPTDPQLRGKRLKRSKDE